MDVTLYFKVLALIVATTRALQKSVKHLTSRSMRPFWRYLLQFLQWATRIWKQRDNLLASLANASSKPTRYLFVAWMFTGAVGFGVWAVIAFALVGALLFLSSPPDPMRIVALAAFMFALAECTRLFFKAGHTHVKRLGRMR